MSTVISVENLTKNYRLGQIGTVTFSHDLEVWWARSLRSINEKNYGDCIEQALKDLE